MSTPTASFALRSALALAIAALAGCASTGNDYADNLNRIDADPLCASAPDQPNEPVSMRCERRIERAPAPREKIDLSGSKRQDGHPR